MAAQMLAHQGFEDVRHLVGGIEGWNQPAAAGPTEFHLQFVRGDETPREMITLGYIFEEGLRRFHQMVQERTEDGELRKLLSSLVKAEESHKQTLLGLIAEQERQQFVDDLNAAQGASVMEGGIDVNDFMARNEPYLRSVTDYLQLAMMVETQALDLYLRMAQASRQEETRRILYKISEEEKAHLAALGRLMEEKAAERP
jgi:rubrerythrin